MATVFYEKDADRSKIAGRKVAVLGYGLWRLSGIFAEERAAFFGKRSVKQQSKLDLLYLALQMMDLTTLEGMDSPGKVRQLCQKAMRPLH